MNTHPESNHYDVLVIGAGPAGYVAAIRCAQLGLTTACIDDWTGPQGEHCLGGTFLNAGCIPSIALLQSARYFQLLQGDIAEHGIQVSGLELDVTTMIQRKNKVVQTLSNQIATLFKANAIQSIHGRARLLDGLRVEVTPLPSNDETLFLTAEHIILATGSTPYETDIAPLDGDAIVDSLAAMHFKKTPKRLGIIGAGVIGLEHASVWGNLGSKVTLLDAQDQFLPLVDQQISQQALQQFKQQGFDIRLGARVIEAKKTPKQIAVHYEDQNGQHKLILDQLIVAIGRKPNTDGLFAAEVDLLLDEAGFVHVDDACMTSLPNIYAIGDLVRGPMLAHKGSEEGILVAETIAGIDRTLDYEAIPCVIYTEPGIAWVGQNEQTLKASGTEIKTGIFPFSANGCAQATGATDGMVKIIADKLSDKILGVHIVGHAASELIAEAVLAIEFSASTEDLVRTIHAHPSLSKALHEAALAVDNKALHIPPM